MSTETVHYDDAPTPVATRPIERRGGVEYVGGTGCRVTCGDVLRRLDNGAAPSSVALVLDVPLEAVEYVQRRAAKKAKRRNPVARKLKANGRACRNRGRDFELYCTKRLASYGFARVPGSGMFGGNLSGDLRRALAVLTVRAGANLVRNGTASVRKIECKRQQAEQRFVRKALAQGGGSQVVIVGKKGGPEPIAFMELAQLEHLLREAGYEVTG